MWAEEEFKSSCFDSCRAGMRSGVSPLPVQPVLGRPTAPTVIARIVLVTFHFLRPVGRQRLLAEDVSAVMLRNLIAFRNGMLPVG